MGADRIQTRGAYAPRSEIYLDYLDDYPIELFIADHSPLALPFIHSNTAGTP